MALIMCPECGGKVSDKATACIHCGYPLQMVDELDNALKLARRAKDEGNTIDAQKYFEVAYQVDPNNWEAGFFLRFFQVINCSNGNCTMLGMAFANAIPEVVNSLQVSDHSNIDAVLSEIHQYCIKASDRMFTVFSDLCNRDNLDNELGVAVVNSLGNLKNAIENTFPDKEVILEAIGTDAAQYSKMIRERTMQYFDQSIANLKRSMRIY